VRHSSEPFFWLLFSSGGMLSALLLPALVFVFLLAAPLGWIEPPPPEALLERLRPAWMRLGILVLIALSLFHWAHRFRFTLYDGLQLHHLYGLLAVLCYGGATVGTGWAAYVLWSL
jgi:fumarate reductase subunit D